MFQAAEWPHTPLTPYGHALHFPTSGKGLGFFLLYQISSSFFRVFKTFFGLNFSWNMRPFLHQKQFMHLPSCAQFDATFCVQYMTTNRVELQDTPLSINANAYSPAWNMSSVLTILGRFRTGNLRSTRPPESELHRISKLLDQTSRCIYDPLTQQLLQRI